MQRVDVTFRSALPELDQGNGTRESAVHRGHERITGHSQHATGSFDRVDGSPYRGTDLDELLLPPRRSVRLTVHHHTPTNAMTPRPSKITPTTESNDLLTRGRFRIGWRLPAANANPNNHRALTVT